MGREIKDFAEDSMIWKFGGFPAEFSRLG